MRHHAWMFLTRRDFLSGAAGLAVLPLAPQGPGGGRAREGENELLVRRAREGLRVRLAREPGPAYAERLAGELSVLTRLGYALPLLFAADVAQRARQLGIPLGPGRGAAPGSLVCYALGITDVDPLPYGLLFERFVNERRPSRPMLQIDVCARQRDRLVSEVLATDGASRVAVARRPVGRATNLVCHAMWARETDDASREHTYRFLQRLDEHHEHRLLREALLCDDALTALVADNAVVARTVAEALQIEDRLGAFDELWTGCTLVFGKAPLPRVGRDSLTGWQVAPFDGNEAIRGGWDTLSVAALPGLTILGGSEATSSEPDEATLHLLAAGDTEGVVGLEAPLMRALLRRSRPRRLEDVVSLLSLDRPGTIEWADEYLDRRHRGVAPVPHRSLTSALAPTFGLPIYQEQIMQCAADVAGLELTEADLFRRALGKKRLADVAPWRRRFVAGAVTRGFAPREAETIFDFLGAYGGYAVCRAHFVASGLLSLSLAHFKAHSPARFHTAVAEGERGQSSFPGTVG